MAYTVDFHLRFAFDGRDDDHHADASRASEPRRVTRRWSTANRGDTSITKRVSACRSLGQGTQWKGDESFCAPDTKKYKRAPAYHQDSFGKWVGGTNNTWGLVQLRCDESTYVNPLGTMGPQTGCVIPGALETFRRLSLTNDAEAPLSAAHVPRALYDPNST